MQDPDLLVYTLEMEIDADIRKGTLEYQWGDQAGDEITIGGGGQKDWREKWRISTPKEEWVTEQVEGSKQVEGNKWNWARRRQEGKYIHVLSWEERKYRQPDAE